MKLFYGSSANGDSKLSLDNLCRFLRKQRRAGLDEAVVRTTYVAGGWDDVQMCAHAVSCKVCRFINPELVERHEFADCFRFVF